MSTHLTGLFYCRPTVRVTLKDVGHVFVCCREVPVGAGCGAVWRPLGQDPAASGRCLLCKSCPAHVNASCLRFIFSWCWFLNLCLWVFDFQIGHLQANIHLISWSIRLGQPFSPVKALLNLVCGPFSCGNMLFHQVMIWFQWGGTGRPLLPNWKENYQS